MWIFTIDGFFSVVNDNYCGHDEVMVRARCKDDLKRMLQRLHGKQCDRLKLDDGILDIKHADYRFRTKLLKRDWMYYVSIMAMEIDYSTVKDNLCPDHYKERGDAMYECWGGMLRFQDRING
jgi:hypothetical protein